MSSFGRGVWRVLVAGAFVLGCAMLYRAFLADVPSVQVAFRLPSGIGMEAHTPLEPSAPGATPSICEFHGAEVRCTVRQTFWQNPFAAHKTGHLVLSIHDPRNCQRTGLAPTRLTVVDHPEVAVVTLPLPGEGCSTRWDLRALW